MTKRRLLRKNRTKSSQSVGSLSARDLAWRCALYVGLALFFLLLVWTFYLDSVVREKFEGKKWALPARVYARPLELYQGLSLTTTVFEQELRALGYRFETSLTTAGQVVKQTTAASNQINYKIRSRGFDFWDKHEPAQTFSLSISNNSIQSLRDLAGADLPLVRLEPEEIGGFYPDGDEDRLLVRLADIPPLLGETLLAVEDKHFLEHHGISPLSILRAAWINITRGNVVQGGSTITQQLVKNFYLNNQQSLFRRKIPEAIMAILLELHYSKPEILETYINEVFLGQSGDRAIHGFALASQHYFRQPLAELKPQELALLVGLVKGASYYNPWKHAERAKERRNVVLTVMHAEKLIDDKQLKKAQAAPLGVVAESQASAKSYPAFLDLIKRQLQQDYAEKDLRSEGLRIFTTLSPMLQRQIERSVELGTKTLERQYKIQNLQASMVITSVGSGEILALVGDKNPRFDGFNRALDAKRQVGSLLKPFVYLTALEIPQEYNLATSLSDAPVSYQSGGQKWEPQNADKIDHGIPPLNQVPLYQGLIHSYNQTTARLGMTLGVSRVTKSIKRAGFNRDISNLPSVLLGSIEMSPLEVAGLYHTLASEGVYAPLRGIREVLTADGKPLKRYPLELEQRFSMESIFQLQYAMHLTMREGTARSVYDRIPLQVNLAGKTGTTNDQRDSWFAGFSGEHVAVVWMGKDDNTETPISGAAGALKIWADVMTQITTQSLSLEPPPGISFDWLDSTTGLLSAEGCDGALWLPLRDNFLPLKAAECRRHDESKIKDFWQKIMN